MKADLAVRGGTVVTPGGAVRADVGIAEGKIIAIGTDVRGVREIDAAGRIVLPGAIDAHVHMELPVRGDRSSDDFRTGTVAAAHGGISVGRDGPSHQSMEDLSNTLVLPNMTVVVPADKPQAEAVTRWAADYVGPVYYRLGREKVPTITDGEGFFEHGKAQVVIEGDDGTIIACGLMVSEAIKAAELLAKEDIFPRVISMATLKPLDIDAIDAAARETGAIVTAEEHSIYGGLGSIVARHIAESHHRVPMRIVGIPDIYLTSGSPEELLQVAGLTAKNITAKLKETLAMR